MMLDSATRFLVVVGSGGVGKTTLAAALGLVSARQGDDTLVMTFDPSHRLKDTLGVGGAAATREVAVAVAGPGRLDASLLDAGTTFDRLVERYAPDPAARERILGNRFYQHLAGTLSGVLEYMAVERLFEVAGEGRYQRVILDTPPTQQALDFLQAPQRIVGFLDSGALKIVLRDWFDAQGRLRPTKSWGLLGRTVEGLLDRVVGLDFLRDMLEFFQAFGPLYEGFRSRAKEVEALLASPATQFVLVTGPGEERVADTLFFARRLTEAGYRLGPIVVNRLHPRAAPGEVVAGPGPELLAWLGEQHARGLTHLRELVGGQSPVVGVPWSGTPPTDLGSLEALGQELMGRVARPAEDG